MTQQSYALFSQTLRLSGIKEIKDGRENQSAPAVGIKQSNFGQPGTGKSTCQLDPLFPVKENVLFSIRRKPTTDE